MTDHETEKMARECRRLKEEFELRLESIEDRLEELESDVTGLKNQQSYHSHSTFDDYDED
jgi:hypothetical protein